MLNSSINSNGIPGIIQYYAIYFMLTIASKYTQHREFLGEFFFFDDVKLIFDIDFDVSMSLIANG